MLTRRKLTGTQAKEGKRQWPGSMAWHASEMPPVPLELAMSKLIEGVSFLHVRPVRGNETPSKHWEPLSLLYCCRAAQTGKKDGSCLRVTNLLREVGMSLKTRISLLTIPADYSGAVVNSAVSDIRLMRDYGVSQMRQNIIPNSPMVDFPPRRRMTSYHSLTNPEQMGYPILRIIDHGRDSW